MILTCPNCGTQYVVKDGAIPPEGRQVRCASCKHSWHQDPEIAETEPELTAAPHDEAPVEVEAARGFSESAENEESLAEAALIEPRSGPEAEERAYEGAVLDGAADPQLAAPSTTKEEDIEEVGDIPSASEESDWREPQANEDPRDMFSPFADDDDQPERRSTASVILVIVLLIVAAAAAFWLFAPPSLKTKLGLTSSGATPLQLVTTHMDRQHLESGNDLLTLTGRVINPSGKEQSVPPIQAQLKNRSGKVVYSWTIQPPTPSLPAGGSAPFNSAEVSVPPTGDELTITLGDGRSSGV